MLVVMEMSFMHDCTFQAHAAWSAALTACGLVVHTHKIK